MNAINLRKAFFLILVAGISYFFLDQEVTTYVAPYSKAYRLLLKGCTFLIFPPLYLALSAGGFVASRLKKSRWTLPFFEILVAQSLSIAFVRVFKIIIGRARPDIFLKKGIYGFYGFEWDHHFHSFPSGHCMAAFTLATSLSYLFPRFRIYFFSVATVLTLSRVLLLGHYCSDILGTAAFALLIGGSVHAMITKITTKYDQEIFL